MERPPSRPASAPPSHLQQRSEGELMTAEIVLRDLYQQVRHLRSTMPRIINVFTTPHESPQVLYKTLCDATLAANKDVKTFSETVANEETRAIFKHCRKSKALNPEGITPWRITEDPDWNKKM